MITLRGHWLSRMLTLQCVARQTAVKRLSGRALDPVQVDIIFHLFGTEAGADSLDTDRFAQVTHCDLLPSTGLRTV